MVSPLFLDKRIKPRKMLTGLLPGPLTDANGERINCKPVDISEHGLGIITSAFMKPGDAINLKLKDRTIALSVSWSKPDFGKQNLIRYGLNLESDQENLEDVFAEAGCLK